MVTRVKICGITRQEDAELAVRLGAHALGFVFEPTSKRFLHRIPDWISGLPVYTARVAVFGKAPAFFGEPEFDAAQGAEWQLPVLKQDKWRRIEVVPCHSELSPTTAVQRAHHAHAVLLDANVEGAFGGTGALADWDVAAEIVRISPKPVILAGGLTPENVAEAILKVRPYAVDVSTGVESEPGIKDRVKMTRFFEAVNGVRSSA